MTLGGEKGWRGMTHLHARIERDAFQSDALNLRGKQDKIAALLSEFVSSTCAS